MLKTWLFGADMGGGYGGGDGGSDDVETVDSGGGGLPGADAPARAEHLLDGYDDDVSQARAFAEMAKKYGGMEAMQRYLQVGQPHFERLSSDAAYRNYIMGGGQQQPQQAPMQQQPQQQGPYAKFWQATTPEERQANWRHVLSHGTPQDLANVIRQTPVGTAIDRTYQELQQLKQELTNRLNEVQYGDKVTQLPANVQAAIQRGEITLQQAFKLFPVEAKPAPKPQAPAGNGQQQPSNGRPATPPPKGRPTDGSHGARAGNAPAGKAKGIRGALAKAEQQLKNGR